MSEHADFVATVGAYDRFNYGDLLFPHLLESVLGSSDVIHVATRKADLSAYGGIACIDQNALGRRATTCRAVILGGGELLGATWHQALITLSSNVVEVSIRSARRIVGTSPLDRLSRAILRGEWHHPYLPDLEFLHERRFVGNAIGASSFLLRPASAQAEMVRTLRRADYLSVRDAAGLNGLKQAGVACTLAPDSAAGLASLPWLPAHRSDGHPGGLVVQCSADWSRHGRLEQFAEPLLQVSANFPVVTLLPIGRASGHGDERPLRRLHRHLVHRGVKANFIEDADVNTCARTIAGAELFVGTSLHGHITAIAYGVPAVALDGVSKLDHYLDTWGSGLTPFRVPPKKLAEAVRRARSVDTHRLEARAQRLSDLAAADLTRVRDAASA